MLGDDWNLAKRVIKGTALLTLLIVGSRFTYGVPLLAFVAMTLVAALSGRMGLALGGYILLPAMMVINPFVLPKTVVIAMTLRLTPIALTVALAVSASKRRGREKIPLTWMWAYLSVAFVSSMMGYYPTISYLKILNFAVLMGGMMFGFRNIDRNSRDLETLRTILLSFCAFIIFGSVALRLAFPGACYLSTMHTATEDGLDAANSMISEFAGVSLFAGITNQSQTLAIVLPISIALLACDMIFVERRISRIHLLSIFFALPLVKMTSSRAALLSAAVGVTVIYLYCLKRVSASNRLRRALRSAFSLGFFALIGLCVVMEMRDQSISRWIRKTEDVSGDQRGWSEALTASRQGKIDENMRDFRQNPILGTGFQVTEDMKYRYRGSGFVFSAPIEKGLLPLMVLGETGVVGAFFFFVFLSTFYGTCAKRRYFATLTLMTVFLASNMGEATFFSPGGVGGVIWVWGVGGGFCIDMLVLNSTKCRQYMISA